MSFLAGYSSLADVNADDLEVSCESNSAIKVDNFSTTGVCVPNKNLKSFSVACASCLNSVLVIVVDAGVVRTS